MGVEADGRGSGGRGLVEVIRTARQHNGRGEDGSSVLKVCETGPGDEMVFRLTM